MRTRSRIGAPETGVLVIGGGPAGLAPLLAASRDGGLDRLLAEGLVVAERDQAIGAGRIGRYLINSDSSAETFLSCIAAHPHPDLAALAGHPAARAIALLGRDAVPLPLVGTFLAALGEVLTGIIRKAPEGRVMTGRQALWTRRTASGGWSTRLRCLSTGREVDILSRVVLLATGADQPVGRLEQEAVAGRPLLPGCADKLMQSDRMLTAEGLAEALERLAPLRHPRLVVIGGSTSAVSCVRVLLEALGDRLGESALTLMHRRALPVFYPSVQAAQGDGYHAFGTDDVCPVSGFVFRFGGLRFDSRSLLRSALRIGDAVPDPRLCLHRLHDAVDTAAVLDRADLVVSAVGYRPRALPVLDLQGHPVGLRAHQPGGALVGPRCGVLDEQGQEIEGLLGIGLAAGFRPGVAMGGEPSFTGQVNGLWLWQNDVGALVVRRMLERLDGAQSPSQTTAKSSVPAPDLPLAVPPRHEVSIASCPCSA